MKELSHPKPRVLEIYVTPDCMGCAMAYHVAEFVRSRALPGLEIRVIDLSRPAAMRPDVVFAVPTYLLDGRVISLGNPDQDWLLEQLTPSPCTRRSSR